MFILLCTLSAMSQVKKDLDILNEWFSYYIQQKRHMIFAAKNKKILTYTLLKIKVILLRDPNNKSIRACIRRQTDIGFPF